MLIYNFTDEQIETQRIGELVSGRAGAEIQVSLTPTPAYALVCYPVCVTPAPTDTVTS